MEESIHMQLNPVKQRATNIEEPSTLHSLCHASKAVQSKNALHASQQINEIV